MSAYRVLSINSRDLASLGVATAILEGPHTLPASRYATTALRGRWGVLRLVPEPDGAPRAFTITCAIVADTQAQLDAKISAVVAWCGRGMLEIKTGHSTDKVFYALPLDLNILPRRPQLVSRAADFRFTLEAHDPLAYAVLGRVVRVTQNNALRPVRIGSGHISGIMRVWNANNPQIEIIDSRGVAQLTIPFNGSVGANDHLILDNLAGTIDLVSSGGAPIDAIDMLALDHDFPAYVDPFWGDPERGVYPYVRVTGLAAGGGLEFFTCLTELA